MAADANHGNGAVARRFFEAWMGGDPAALDAVVAPDYVFHDPADPATPPGPGGGVLRHRDRPPRRRPDRRALGRDRRPRPPPPARRPPGIGRAQSGAARALVLALSSGRAVRPAGA